jgi:antitoxin CptB
MESNNLKKLLYRSAYRGCKETDFLIGQFVKAKINEMSEQQLKILENFLVEDDLEIYDWVLGKEEVVEEYEGLVKLIRKFHKINS